jgi:hypothetical protein
MDYKVLVFLNAEQYSWYVEQMIQHFFSVYKNKSFQSTEVPLPLFQLQKVSYLGYIAKRIGPTSQATADIDQELVANLHL